MKTKNLLATLGLLALGFKQTAFAAAADPTTITTAANTAFEAVTVVLVAVAIFFTVLYYARRAKGR